LEGITEALRNDQEERWSLIEAQVSSFDQAKGYVSELKAHENPNPNPLTLILIGSEGTGE